MAELSAVVLKLTPQAGFVETPYVRELVERCLSYIKAGYPVHFRGSAGTGKTSLALHVAFKLGRPVVLVYGHEEVGVSDLIGGQYGFHRRRIVDNFIHSVLKTEEDATARWVDERITVACRYGYTLVYDEFTRSRPESNNVLLSVFEERILNLPVTRGGEHYLRVHPSFAAIFTSNPEEYAGVHKSQDALRDRMVTIDLDDFDRETEIAITVARSGIPAQHAARVVDVVRALRMTRAWESRPTVRGCIMVARVLAQTGATPSASDPLFRQVCTDILASETTRRATAEARSALKSVVSGLIDEICAEPAEPPADEAETAAHGSRSEGDANW